MSSQFLLTSRSWVSSCAKMLVLLPSWIRLPVYPAERNVGGCHQDKDIAEVVLNRPGSEGICKETGFILTVYWPNEIGRCK